MFLPTDSVTEIIAHFIGYFHLEVEQARLHPAYDGFAAATDQLPLPGEAAPAAPRFAPDLPLIELDAHVHYVPPDWGVIGHRGGAGLSVPLAAPALPAGHPGAPGEASAGLPMAPGAPPPGAPPLLAEVPGAVTFEVSQVIVLGDNDVVVLGDADGPVRLPAGTAAAVAHLAGEALAIAAPLTELHGPATIQQIPAYLDAAVTAVHGIAATPATDGLTLHATAGASLAGSFLDGAATTAPPEFAASLPAGLQPPPEPAPPPAAATAATTLAGGDAPALTLVAGANALTNDAAIVNAGLSPAMVAVVGDWHQLDAIVQTNAHADTDRIDPALPGAATAASAGTLTHSIATFGHTLPDAGGVPAPAHSGIFPDNWQVSIVPGDLTFASWTTQYSFITDCDVHVLTATGITTTLTTGGNTALNATAFTDIGHAYDLLLVGGSLYDANIISQTNVLYDNDTVTATGAAGVAGSLSTSGNLLWNEASILRIGPTAPEAGLPDAFRQAAAALDGGDGGMPAALRAHQAFEGLDTLRVLYVAGNLYDLNYVSQVNVLGDADSVALHEAAVRGAAPATQWHVETGGNALANLASIVDYDNVGGTSHVGGNFYSDAVLIQADLVSPATSEDNTPDGHAAPLANEAIAFLDSGIEPSPTADDPSGVLHHHVDAPPADIMQSVLA